MTSRQAVARLFVTSFTDQIGQPAMLWRGRDGAPNLRTWLSVVETSDRPEGWLVCVQAVYTSFDDGLSLAIASGLFKPIAIIHLDAKTIDYMKCMAQYILAGAGTAEDKWSFTGSMVHLWRKLAPHEYPQVLPVPQASTLMQNGFHNIC